MSFKKSWQKAKRLKQIGSVFLELELYHLIDVFSLRHHVPFYKRFSKGNSPIETQPETVRLIFEKLGGAFLKLGQLLALRPDLVGSEYAKAFEKLLDHIEPVSWKEIESSISEYLPNGVNSFRFFEKTPIASGSIAQVHRAELSDGTIVAVKIRRPNIKKKFESDISIMYDFAGYLSKKYDLDFMNPKEIIEEFEVYTLKELDLTHEARNIKRFQANFAQEKNIHIPKIYDDLSNENILVMEYVHGENLLEHRPVELNRQVIDILTKSVYKQLFEDGFFHADLHPGNLFVLDVPKSEKSKGSKTAAKKTSNKDSFFKRNRTANLKVVYLDFGIVGYIDSILKKQIGSLFISLVNADLQGTAQALIALNTADSDPNQRELEVGIYHAIGEYYNMPLDKMPITKMLNNCIDVARKNKIALPSQMVLFSKSLLTLEGSCRELDPNFNIVESAKPYVKGLMKFSINFKELPKKSLLMISQLKQVFGDIPVTLKSFERKIFLLERKIGEIDNTFHYLSHVIWRVSKLGIYSLLFSAFLLSASILVHTGPMFYDVSIYSIIAAGWALVLLFLIIVNLHDNTDTIRKN